MRRLAGAAIWVQSAPGDSAYSGPSGAFDLTTRTASTGTRLLVTAAGYLYERTDVAASEALNPAEVKIGLTPAASIAGVVTHGSGQPVAGAKIWAEPRGTGVSRFSSAESGPAYAAPDGSFVVEGAVYRQTYRLTAEAPGYARALLDVPPVEPGRVIEPVHLTLSRGRRVVGRVVGSPGPRAAQVQLLIDRNAAAGALIERTRASGVVVGTDDSSRLQLEYVSNLEDVQVGDEIVTSGINGIYPKGFRIGVVTEVANGVGLYQLIQVSPVVEFSHIEDVLVVLDAQVIPSDTDGE